MSRKYEISSDDEETMLTFLTDRDEFLVTGDSKFIIRSDFYPRYLVWCRVNKRTPLGKKKAFSLIRSKRSVGNMGVRIAFIRGHIPVIRGLSWCDEL